MFVVVQADLIAYINGARCGPHIVFALDAWKVLVAKLWPTLVDAKD